MQERLQKILAHHGIASRRHAEEWISAGRVTVNGVKAELGQKADPEIDQIAVDGKPLKASAEKVYYLMHKPVGYVTTNLDEETWKERGVSQRATTHTPHRIEKTVRELLPKELRGKIVSVGRLDKESSGLLLFTNDGDLAYRLTHPKFSHEREYLVELEAPITYGALEKLENGVLLDGSKTKPARIEHLGERRYSIALTEGRYHQVRRMFSKVGSKVASLERVRIATLTDDTLLPGQLRPLTPSEIAALRAAVQL